MSLGAVFKGPERDRPRGGQSRDAVVPTTKGLMNSVINTREKLELNHTAILDCGERIWAKCPRALFIWNRDIRPDLNGYASVGYYNSSNVTTISVGPSIGTLNTVTANQQKLAVLAEAMAPGANISAVARRHSLLPAQVYKWRRLAELGVIGVPGASELPSFVAVEITKDVPSLPAPVLEDKPATADDAPGRRQRKKAGLIEIELESGRRVRVDRDVDAAALARVLDVLARR